MTSTCPYFLDVDAGFDASVAGLCCRSFFNRAGLAFAGPAVYSASIHLFLIVLNNQLCSGKDAENKKKKNFMIFDKFYDFGRILQIYKFCH